MIVYGFVGTDWKNKKNEKRKEFLAVEFQNQA